MYICIYIEEKVKKFQKNLANPKKMVYNIITNKFQGRRVGANPTLYLRTWKIKRRKYFESF